MGQSFFKAIKWFLFISFIIGGIAAMTAVEEHGIRPVILAVLSFGAAYIVSASWRNLPTAPMVASIVLCGLMALGAYYFPDLVYIATGDVFTASFFLIWVCLVFGIGVPVMTYVFNKYD